jgi:uncharacterized MAPEG superfamily protein
MGESRLDIYSSSIIGLALVCLVPIILANAVGPMKGKAGAIGGPVADARDDNPLYRMDRAHGNSVESIPMFVLPAILAMLAGVGPGLLAALVWAYVVIRLVYVVVYLRGGPLGKGGSLRTVIYVLGAIANLAVVLATIVAAA